MTLVAFDNVDLVEASEILYAAHAGMGKCTDMQWSHPSVDIPGTFPRAAPLHYAIFSGRDQVIGLLLQHWPEQINHTGTDIDGRTPLEYALSVHRLNEVRVLIKNGALIDLDVNQNCLLDVSVMENNELWANNGLFQASGEDLGVERINTVAEAAPSLLDMPEELGFTPLMQAATNHKPHMLQCFISHSCNVNTTTSFENDGRTPLNLITENHLDNEENDIIARLLKAGANLDHRTSKGGKHVLHFAARDDKLWVARQILDLGVDINMTTTYGETPLHCAVFYGSYGVGQLLLERGATVDPVHSKATVNHRDWQGLTPIAFAVVRLRRDFIDLLLDYGALPLARPSHKDIVIHLAVLEEGLGALEMALQVPQFRTPEVLNAKNSRGVTALHPCAGNIENYAQISLLVEAGADVNVLSGNGFSALDLACTLKGFISTNLVSLASDDFYRHSDKEPASSTEGRGGLPLHDVKRWAEVLKASDAKSGPFDQTEQDPEAREYEGAYDHSKNSATKPQYEYVKIELNAEERICIQVIALLLASGAERYNEDGALEEFLFME